MTDLAEILKSGFEMYRSFNEAYPVLGSMATAAVIFPSSDIASQLIMDHQIDWRKVKYTAALSPIYGTAIYGCIRSADIIPEFLHPQPLAKSSLGPNLWGNVLNLFFFVNNTVGERRNYSLSNLVEHYFSFCSSENGAEAGKQEERGLLKHYHAFINKFQEKVLSFVPRDEYAKATLGTFTLWNAFQYANYAYIPNELQTPATLAVVFAWTILLSTWSLVGRRKNNLQNLES